MAPVSFGLVVPMLNAARVWPLREIRMEIPVAPSALVVAVKCGKNCRQMAGLSLGAKRGNFTLGLQALVQYA